MKALVAAIYLLITLATPGIAFAIQSCNTTAQPHVCRCYDVVTRTTMIVAC